MTLESEVKPSIFLARLRALGPKPTWGGVEQRPERTRICTSATPRPWSMGERLRLDSLKGKSFSGPFRSHSNRFEDRATSWRRDTAHRRICATTHSCVAAAKLFWLRMLNFSFVLTAAIVPSPLSQWSRKTSIMSPLSHPSPYRLPPPLRPPFGGHQLPVTRYTRR